MLALILQFLLVVVIASTGVYLFRLGVKIYNLKKGVKHKELRSPEGGIKAPWGW